MEIDKGNLEDEGYSYSKNFPEKELEGERWRKGGDYYKKSEAY